MYEIAYSNQFNKDLKLAAKRGYNIELLRAVIKKLHTSGKLEPHYRPHKLQGKYNNYMECHIKSDWLLIWKQDDKEKSVMLTRTGTHTDLF
jgi:mRNA interferase YafQ